jgi:hypothetical protein
MSIWIAVCAAEKRVGLLLHYAAQKRVGAHRRAPVQGQKRPLGWNVVGMGSIQRSACQPSAKDDSL